MKNCEECGYILIQREGERPSKFSARRFCSNTCSSRFTMGEINKNLDKDGRTPWNKGKQMPEEYRETCRRAKLGVRRVELVKVNCETCGKELFRTPGVLKFRKHNFCDRKCGGQFRSKEFKGKKFALGHKHTEETIKIIKEKRASQVIPKGEEHHLFGTKHSEEHKQKISDSHVGVKKTEEHKKNISMSKMGELNPQYGKPPWNKGIPTREETRLKLRHARSIQSPMPTTHSLPARVIEHKLREAGVSFITEKYFLGGRTIADIFIEPNIIIFVDGCYYHACPHCISKGMIPKDPSQHETDLRNKRDLEREGYRVIRLPTHTFMSHRAKRKWNRLFNIT